MQMVSSRHNGGRKPSGVSRYRIMTGLQLPLQFDRARLRADLDGIGPDEWLPHYNNQDYGGEWRGVPLRSLRGSASDLSASVATPAIEFAPAPALSRCSYFQEVLGAFPCRLKAVRLLRLSSGSVVHEHSDPQLGYEYGEMRIHVPVQTSSEVEFKPPSDTIPPWATVRVLR